jgi:hypothetical protein
MVGDLVDKVRRYRQVAPPAQPEASESPRAVGNRRRSRREMENSTPSEGSAPTADQNQDRTPV